MYKNVIYLKVFSKTFYKGIENLLVYAIMGINHIECVVLSV